MDLHPDAWIDPNSGNIFEPTKNAAFLERDMYGRELKITLINQADALSSIATLAMGETSEATPVVLIKGLNQEMNSSQRASDIIRPREDDLFCD